MSKTPEDLYKERAKRVDDVINLRLPDRIPIIPSAQFFPFKYTGITVEEGMYDYNKAYEAWEKWLVDFEIDDECTGPCTNSGIVYEYLNYKQLRWPGHGSSSAASHEFVEPGQILEGHQVYEPMSAEEYDWFLDDPSDYMIRSYFPKIFNALEPLRNLPPIHGVISWYQGIFDILATIASPEFIGAFEAISKASAEALVWFNSSQKFIDRISKLGYPIFAFAISHAPYDVIANFLRGTQGAMIDMYRNPDKLLQACDKITPWMIKAGIDGAKATCNPIVQIYLHKGFEGLMSENQFKTFYWPTLKKVVMGLIDEGLIPLVYTEGDYTSRLEIIKDVPRGKVIFHIEKDLFKAKEVLGNIACLKGGPPNSLLCTGTPDEVKDYCKKLISVVGKDGGYILDTAAPMSNEDPRNVKTMIDFFKKYGVY